MSEDGERHFNIHTDPDPPALVRFLLGTHPSTMERIGLAKRFER